MCVWEVMFSVSSVALQDARSETFSGIMGAVMPQLENHLPEGKIILYSEGEASINVRVEGETVWLTQRAMADLYGVSVKTVNEHVINIYEEGELPPEGTIRKFRIVQLEGKRSVSRLVDHYSLEAILAVGYVERYFFWYFVVFRLGRNNRRRNLLLFVIF